MKPWAWLVLAGWLLAPCPSGAEVLGLYDDAYLRHWQTITPQDARAVYRESILPALTRDERALLVGLEFEFPLRAPGEQAGREPFAFYAWRDAAGRPRVTASMLSLRLFSDLSLALVWLEAHGYAIDAPANYLTLLKYRPALRLPPPSGALGLPTSARDEPAVARRHGEFFTSGIVFVLLHELGHLRHGHVDRASSDPAASQRQEAQADAFALEVMARLGYPPVGAVGFFTFAAHWLPNRWDFETEAAWRDYVAHGSHPLTGERLRALAAVLRSRAEDFARKAEDIGRARAATVYIAGQIEGIAGLLDDEEVQQGIALLGRTLAPAALAPRKPGEPMATGVAPTPADQPFSGRYRGEFTDAGGTLEVVLELERRGDEVVGAYSFGLGVGRIRGRVQGAALHYLWQYGADTGRGVLRAGEGGRLEGHWGRGGSDRDGGTAHMGRY